MKTVRISLLILGTWVLWLVVSQYLLGIRFHFEEHFPFEGTALYNPYEGLDARNWIKCNFHAHAKAWNGVTNGHGTASDVHDAYRSLHYGVHCVSNYHFIDSTGASEQSFIPAYEHGYNLTKTHQLILGSQQVQWLDYLLPQTIHNKQDVLKNLKTQNNVIILNHPHLRKGYTRDDLSQLSDYDCMEVLNPAIISTGEWDAALSAGKKVFIVGNDDTHDVLAKARLGKMCTLVNVPDNQGELVLRALKAGQSYGVEVGENQSIDSIPLLRQLRMDGAAMTVEMDQVAQEVTVTGQNGKVLASYQNTNIIRYCLQKSAHYARATFKYSNGTTIYLNPVFFTPPTGYEATVAYVDNSSTTLYRALGISILILWILAVRWMVGYPRNLRYRTGQFSIR